jgi:selenocysteine-specific elongation factor
LASALGVDAARLRAALETNDELAVERGVVRHVSHRSRVADSPEAGALLAALSVEPFSPADPKSLGFDQSLVRSLVREGPLVDLDGIVFTASALADARARVKEALRERGSLTVADARDLLGSTRKFVLPILNRLDAEGVTRRRGDERLPGAATLRE